MADEMRKDAEEWERQDAAEHLQSPAAGQKDRLVLNNIANKALKLICGVIRSGKPYIKTYVSQKI